MKRIIILASAAIIIFAGVFLFIILQDDSPDKDTYSVTLPEALREITEENRRLMFSTPDPDLADVVKGYQTPDLDAETDAAIAKYLKQSKQEDSTKPEYLSHEEITSELDYLFDLLKCGYGGYQYFGGDEVFGAAKQLMLKKLSVMTDPISIDSYLNDVLLPCLRVVIADNHFSLGGQGIGIDNQLYLNDELIVRKVDNDYTTVMDGRTYRVLRAGRQLEGLLPTLTRDGELAWAFGGMKSGGDKLVETGMGVELEDVETQEKSYHRISVNAVSDQYRTSLSQDLYTIREQDGITVLENRRLQTYENDPPIAEFVSTGNALRYEPILILDLRCNGGGNDGSAKEWMMGYMWRPPTYAMFLTTYLHSLTAYEINQNTRALSPPKWDMADYQSPNYFPNDNLIIVLMDNAIASAGESFIGYLRQLDNVVFVGTNTHGCLVTGNVGGSELPISKLLINFGISLNIRPDLSQFEGVGFMPDLWVPPGESLERVLQFVKRYKTVE